MLALPEIHRSDLSAFEANVAALKDYKGTYEAFVHYFAHAAEAVYKLGQEALPLCHPSQSFEAFNKAMNYTIVATMGYLAACDHIQYIEMDIGIREHVEAVERFITTYAKHIQDYGVAVATDGDPEPASSILDRARRAAALMGNGAKKDKKHIARGFSRRI